MLFATPFLDKIWLNRLKGNAICLCYHRVDDSPEFQYLEQLGLPVISPQELREDIQALKKFGFRFITFKDWHRDGRLDPDKPNVILTFDDGYKDQYAHARPVMESEGVRGVFFQSTAMTQSSKLIWQHFVFELIRDDEGYEKLSSLCHQLIPKHMEKARLRGESLAYYLVEELPQERAEMIMQEARKFSSSDKEEARARSLYPSEEEIKEAHKNGHEIACHGHVHLKRSNVSTAQFEADLMLSIQKIRSCTGEEPISYAFPHGNYYEQDIAIVSKYFSFVATVESGIITPETNKLKLPRFYWGKSQRNRVRKKRWLLTGVA